MKNLILSSVWLLMMSFFFLSCDKDSDTKDEDPLDIKSSYELVIEGITSTTLMGEITICPDGFLLLNGTSPDGKHVSASTGKILVGENIIICNPDLDEYFDCIETEGTTVSINALDNNYYGVSGTADRTSINDMELSGMVRKLSDGKEYPFSIKATASIVSPVVCE